MGPRQVVSSAGNVERMEMEMEGGVLSGSKKEVVVMSWSECSNDDLLYDIYRNQGLYVAEQHCAAPSWRV